MVLNGVRRSSFAASLGVVLSTVTLVAFGACAPARRRELPSATIARTTFVDTAGSTTTLPDDFARSKLTVVVFYADHCPCFRIHEERLRDLARDYGPRGVRVLYVDSEVSASAERDARAASERGLPAIVLDPGAKLADALDAEYATYTVIVDATGRLRYRGGMDSDKNRLNADAQAFVRDALDDLLAGREPRRTEGKALGCALQKR
jgi:hypothetical protein